MSSHTLFLSRNPLSQNAQKIQSRSGGGGGDHSDPYIRGRASLQIIFLAFRALVWSGSATANGLLAKTVGMGPGQ